MVVCLERGADLLVAQLMPLPLTVSCFSKIEIGFTSLLPAYPGSPGKRAVKRVCVCVCVCARAAVHTAVRKLALFVGVYRSRVTGHTGQAEQSVESTDCVSGYDF